MRRALLAGLALVAFWFAWSTFRDALRTDDERKTPRCDYYDARTGQKYGRRGNMPADAVVERRPRVSKYRFALAIRRPNGVPCVTKEDRHP